MGAAVLAEALLEGPPLHQVGAKRALQESSEGIGQECDHIKAADVGKSEQGCEARDGFAR